MDELNVLSKTGHYQRSNKDQIHHVCKKSMICYHHFIQII